MSKICKYNIYCNIILYQEEETANISVNNKHNIKNPKQIRENQTTY